MEVNELFNLSKKTAIVTGGGKGLGAQIAHGLAEAGANVVVCSRDLASCEKVSQELQSKGVSSKAFLCDITNEKEIQNVIDETMKHYGNIDILVNNSGTSWMAPTLDLPADKWDKVMNVNLKGLFLFSQKVARIMMKQGSGKIINIASVSGMGGTDPRLMDTIAYNTSKGGVITFTKDLGVKLAPHNIQVNAIAPGMFPTKITKGILEHAAPYVKDKIPAKRFGGEYDLKGAVVFLSSKASDYCVGHVLVMDGGMTSLI
ncbi:SDR family oxidoreductase [Sutcliffiella rhizosphaerae]|uniref:5-keto-D-gluconate 5-reductase n=1 Tax=Sutcliffiella rhizosphaerae TaxID=2880967 RepID=A0ABM8YME3_9BACI|nr:SDR family oxidoreductase [Sutcliffiella rhizosphaerae]CAG9620972.1 5-keto-D-gluconate 5-reductase [Sutcliffiella rhizosphaerae]